MDAEPPIRVNPWKNNYAPRRILVMRFQALGDTIITLPYLQSLKRQHPETELHFVTREEVHGIPKHAGLFEKTVVIKGGRSVKLQLIFILLKLPWLWLQKYDAVIDLQNNKLSRLIRKSVRKKAWTEFDRYSPIPAGERTRRTIEALWTWRVTLDPNFMLDTTKGMDLLKKNGHVPGHDLIVLNPAGYCASRHWPIENYVAFAEHWLQRVNPMTQFVLLLLPSNREKADYIKTALGTKCIDLTGKAGQLEAFSIIKNCKLMLSEDSGLMHMSWVQGVPTIALFSSSRKEWSAPQGSWSYCFDSADLECGPCMKETCIYGDNRCLTRYTPQDILLKAIHLYGNQ